MRLTRELLEAIRIASIRASYQLKDPAYSNILAWVEEELERRRKRGVQRNAYTKKEEPCQTKKSTRKKRDLRP